MKILIQIFIFFSVVVMQAQPTSIHGNRMKDNTIGTTQLEETGVIAGSYGINKTIPNFTIGSDGRITSAGSSNIEYPAAFFSQLGHGFVKGDLVRYDAIAGELVKADSYDFGNEHQFVVSKILDANSVELIESGLLSSIFHSYKVGKDYYLQPDGSVDTLSGYYLDVFAFSVPSASELLFSKKRVQPNNALLHNLYSLKFDADSAETVSFKIKTSDATSYTIDWGDGTSNTVSSNSTGSHTYTPKFSGQIEITFNSSALVVEELEITGSVAFDIETIFTASPRIERFVTTGGLVKGYGDMSRLPNSLTYIDTQTGDYFGDFTETMSRSMERIRMVGGKIAFDVGRLPNTLDYLGVTGQNKCYGVIHTPQFTNCTHYDLKGQNTVTGDLGLMANPFPEVFALQGKADVDDYTSGNLDFSQVSMKIFIFSNSLSSFSTAEMDDFFNEVENSTWTSSKNLIMNGAHAPPSGASSTARNNLQNQGVSITTN